MLRRILITYGVELQRSLGSRQYLAGLLLIATALAAAPFVHPIESPGAGAYPYIAYVTPLVLNFLGFVLIQIFAAAQISGDMSTGAIRLMLVRPIRRAEYYLAKFGLCLTYVLLLTGITAAGTWGCAAVWGTLHGVHYGGQLVASHHELAMTYLWAFLLGILPQCAGLCVALFFSALMRSSTAAAAFTLGTWIVLDIIKYPLGIEKLVYSSYLEAPWQVFAERVDAMEGAWTPMAYYCAGTSAATMLVFALAAMAVLQRRNLGA
ncbi:MAG: ABC transporter permease subunit [Candidatus Hydrogenedentes bacterium]|nr:ABC transporter permease subunit [Candidatus Hydrogenedentota bacterium]